MRRLPVRWLWLGLVATEVHADVSLFRGPPGGRGNVEVRDESGQSPPSRPAELQGIEILPIDVVGRSRVSNLLEGESRLRTDIPGAGRVLLPGDRGAVYRYRRDDPPGGPATFGLFVVGSDGIARSLWEIPGAGPSRRGDPLLERIAVSSQGDSILVATTLEAGGDLVEIDVASGKAQIRTESTAPLSFRKGGLSLLRSFGVGLSSSGPWRFERVNGAQAEAVAFPGATPEWFGADLVKSAGEKGVAFLAGAWRNRALVFVCGPSGSAIQGSSEPAHLSGAGFLPDHPTGPLLALSTDASWVAWCTENEYSRECWVRRVGAPADAPSYQVTQDANFEDTLNDTGVISFIGPESFFVVVGETEDHGTLVEADLFRVDASETGLPAITNLSRTARWVSPPYSYGTLEAEDGVFHMPTGRAVLLRAPEQEGSLVRIDVPSGKSETLLDRVTAVDFVETTAGLVSLSARRSDPLQPRVILKVPLAPDEPLIELPLPEACAIDRVVTRRHDGVLGAVLELAGEEWLNRTTCPDGTTFLTPRALRFGPTVAFATDDSLASTILVGSTWYLVLWKPQGGAELLEPGIPEGFLLPGN